MKTENHNSLIPKIENENSDNIKPLPIEESEEDIIIQKETQAGKDLQKEFDMIRKNSGENDAINFLINNFDRNKRYVKGKAIIMSGAIGEEMRRWSENLFESSARQIQAELYIRFRDLSERQKTKIGGFPGFIRKEMSDLTGDTPMETEKRFMDELLKDAKRDDMGGTIYNGTEDFVVSGRPNYKKESKKLGDEVEKIAKHIELLKKLEGLIEN